jgi:hypothetical protein
MLTRFLELLNYDPSRYTPLHLPRSEVRKSVLWNIPLINATLYHVIKRTRDKDPQIRKSVYLRLLNEPNPVNLTLQQKNDLLKNGLFDRDEKVKTMCLKYLCEKWIGDVDVFQVQPNTIYSNTFAARG